MLDEIQKAMPVQMAMLIAALMGLWKHTLDLRKEHREELKAKDNEIKELSKELVKTARGLDLLREKHERVLGRSSNPPQS